MFGATHDLRDASERFHADARGSFSDHSGMGTRRAATTATSADSFDRVEWRAFLETLTTFANCSSRRTLVSPYFIESASRFPVEMCGRKHAFVATLKNSEEDFMTKRPIRLLLTIALFASPTVLAASPVADEAGVRDAENRWSEAFVSGDAATLSALLDKDYVSVGTAGKPRPKAEIIGLATAYAKAHPGEHATPMSATSTIRVIGNAAVVQHRSDGDSSADVFYFRDGHWYAWYSQHTKVEK
jgi:hypothetical protein